MQNNSYLENESLTILMRKYAVPCVISLLVGALYNIVDQIFIANADYLGSYGNAANTVVFPLTVIALAVAVMIGDGCSTYMSMSLGAKKPEEARQAVGSAVVAMTAGGMVLLAVYLFFSTPLIRFFGGAVNERTFACAQEYLFWIALGIPLYMFGQGMNPVIRADGAPRYAMKVTLAGAVTNIILDPVFIFAVRWGMKGAAIATVIGQMLTALLTVLYLKKMKTVTLKRKDLGFHPGIMKKYLPLGMTSLLSQVSLVASMAAVNGAIQKYSLLDPVFGNPAYTQIPMAVIGIVMKFFQIVISAVVGTAAGCAPLAAYNTGAGRNDRVMILFSLLLRTEAVIGIVALLIVELLPRQLIGLFGAANESIYYTEFALKAFRIYLCMILAACINKAAFIYLQALGKALLSTVLSLFREVVLGVVLPLFLPVLFGLDGILYSMPVADLMAFVMTAVVIRYIYGMLKQPLPADMACAEVNGGTI